MKMFIKSLIAISILSVASISHASQGFYIGLDVGQATYDATLQDVAILDDGSITSASLDDTDTSFGLKLGYQVTPNFSLEGGYLDLGELVVNATSDGSGFLYAPGPVSFTVSADGLFFNGKGILPLNEKFSLYGKLGFLLWDIEGTLSDTTVSVSASDDGNDIFYGIGGSFNITTSIALNADYMFYTLDDGDVDVLSLGIQFGF